MQSGESKKLAILYSLEILRSETDIDHPIYQEEIVNLLESR